MPYLGHAVQVLACIRILRSGWRSIFRGAQCTANAVDWLYMPPILLSMLIIGYHQLLKMFHILSRFRGALRMMLSTRNSSCLTSV